MGKIIKFDPKRRRGGQGKPSWTRPEDYGVAPEPRRKPTAQPRHRRAEQPHTSPRTALLARLTVAGVIGLGVAVSVFGLQ